MSDKTRGMSDEFVETVLDTIVKVQATGVSNPELIQAILRAGNKYRDLMHLKVPSWAGSMVANFRHSARIPADISDLLLFVAIETESICVIDGEENQIEALRSIFNLPLVPNTRRRK